MEVLLAITVIGAIAITIGFSMIEIRIDRFEYLMVLLSVFSLTFFFIFLEDNQIFGILFMGFLSSVSLLIIAKIELIRWEDKKKEEELKEDLEPIEEGK